MVNTRRSEPPRRPSPAATRRAVSAGKLSQFFGSSSPSAPSASSAQSALQTGLQELATINKLTLKMAEAQRRGVEAMARWARDSQNAAIDDVMQQTARVLAMHADKQQQFASDYEYGIQQLHKIADADRSVRDAQRRLQALDDREKKLRKDINKGISFFRNRKGGDICLMRQQLEDVQLQRERMEQSVEETRAEMEVVKMFHYRHGMQGIADAQRTLAANSAAIFSCHRELTEMVPAISTQDVRRMVYDGMPVTRERVDELRRQLETLNGCPHHQQAQPRRRSEPARSRASAQAAAASGTHYRHGTPPPPYSPSAPPTAADASTTAVVQLHPRRQQRLAAIAVANGAVQRSTASDSQLLQPFNGSNMNGSPHPHSNTPIQPQNLPPSSRHSMHVAPCSHCGRIYPELPPNPYMQMKQRQSGIHTS